MRCATLLPPCHHPCASSPPWPLTLSPPPPAFTGCPFCAGTTLCAKLLGLRAGDHVKDSEVNTLYERLYAAPVESGYSALTLYSRHVQPRLRTRAPLRVRRSQAGAALHATITRDPA